MSKNKVRACPPPQMCVHVQVGECVCVGGGGGGGGAITVHCSSRFYFAI